MLRRIFQHVNSNMLKKWPELGGLELTIFAANRSTGYSARSGSGNFYLFHDEMARPVFQQDVPARPLVGTTGWTEPETAEVPLQAGDISILLNPSIARVIGVRDLTLILHRAPEPARASLFLSAIAERKGAQGALAALLWEIPNYQGASMLTEERGSGVGDQAPEGADLAGPEQADQAKKHWLNLWRRKS
jgi:hypothetical protein